MKNYLRVDYEEDDALLLLIMDAAKEYINRALGYFDESIARIKMMFLMLVSSMYENRSFVVNSTDKAVYIVQSMVLQLQLEGEASEQSSG